MKHPIRDRIVILLCALCALCGAAAGVLLTAGRLSLVPAIELLGRINNNVGASLKIKAALIVCALVLVALAVLLISAVLPGKRRRSSSFAIQKNENGTVRISLKALDALVQKCLNQHAELKVVTSSLFSDEESIRVDVHITLQSDISMPLAISALQKQIKKYLEACSGVVVQEFRVFVDNTTPATEETARSPYAIPASLLGMEMTEALPGASDDPSSVASTAPVCDPDELTVSVEPELEPEQPQEEPDITQEPEQAEAGEPEETADDKETGDWA